MAVLRFDPFELDTTLYQLRNGTEVLDVGPRVFDVLAYLIRHRDRLISRDELIRQVWGVTAMSDSSVPTCIAAIRKALGDDPAKPCFIETHRGRGYRFIAPVDPLETDGGPSDGGDSAFARFVRPDIHRAQFVGRERELSALYAAFERSLAGSPQLVLVMGEPGIGKTRTIEEFAFAVREDGARTLIGRSIEGEGAPAFWPWIQIVRSFIDSPDASGFPDSVGPLASSLAQMIPELADQFPELPKPPDLDPEKARFRLFDAVTALLEAAARKNPLVVLIDDLHSADAASVSLLHFATRELRDARILILGTYRDNEIANRSGHARTLSDLAREESARSIQLRGFELQNVEQFVAEFAPGRASRDELAASLHEQTGGNPFFLTQVVHLLANEGLLERDDPDTLLSLDLPNGIREAVSRQLDGLPYVTSAALGVAAVAGREFDAAILAAVGESDLQSTQTTLEPALGAHLITRVSGSPTLYRFAHVLLRDCVYEALPSQDRTFIHLAIAQSIEGRYAGRLGPRAAELAYHYSEAVPGADLNRAIHYSVMAAQWADSRLAYEDAPAHYRRAIRLLDQKSSVDPVEYGNLLLTLGDAEIKAGDRNRATETFKEAVAIARESNDSEILARAALGLAPGFFAIEVGVYDAYLVDLLKEALERIPDEDTPLRARLLARLSTALVWTNADQQREKLANESLKTARITADPAAVANALFAFHGCLWESTDWAKIDHVLNEISASSMSANDQELQLLAKVLVIRRALERGKMPTVVREISDFTNLAAASRRPGLIWYSELFDAMIAMLHGDFSEAKHASERFRKTGELAQDKNAIHAYLTQTALLMFEAGESRSIVPAIQKLLKQFPTVSGWRSTLAFLLAEIGAFDEARIEFEYLAKDNFEDLAGRETDAISLNLLAATAFLLGDEDRAALLYQRLLPHSHNHTVIAYAVAYFGPVADRLGQLAALLGNQTDSARHFAYSIAASERVHSPQWIARSHLHAADALVRIGGTHRASAKRHYETALAISATVRSVHLQNEIRQLGRKL